MTRLALVVWIAAVGGLACSNERMQELERRLERLEERGSADFAPRSELIALEQRIAELEARRASVDEGVGVQDGDRVQDENERVAHCVQTSNPNECLAELAPTTQREYELVIEANRELGRADTARPLMQAYIDQYPTSPKASQYIRFLRFEAAL
ncbi:MAG: hypothetical protein AAGF12_22090 [Myxococcota bacterium]